MYRLVWIHGWIIKVMPATTDRVLCKNDWKIKVLPTITNIQGALEKWLDDKSTANYS